MNWTGSVNNTARFKQSKDKQAQRDFFRRQKTRKPSTHTPCTSSAANTYKDQCELKRHTESPTMYRQPVALWQEPFTSQRQAR